MPDIVARGPADADALAVLHAAAFATPWHAQVFRDFLSGPDVFALGQAGSGFILCRVAADEAEILTLAATPAVRRQGLGLRLVEAAVERAAGQGAARLFLEVAEDNAAARGLYARAGFVEVGRRRGYYARPDGPAVDALVLAREFNGCLPSA